MENWQVSFAFRSAMNRKCLSSNTPILTKTYHQAFANNWTLKAVMNGRTDTYSYIRIMNYYQEKIRIRQKKCSDFKKQ